MKIQVNISHIYSSPEHHYFTREKFDVGLAQTYEHKKVQLEEGKGIGGDRFEFSKYPLTFISDEVARDVCKKLDLPYKPSLFRRNFVISGINLNQLIGKQFVISGVGFEGLEYCAPCPWMNAVMQKGAYGLMRGRGGLRAKVIDAGTLITGTNTLITQGEFALVNPLETTKKPRIP